MQSGGGGEGVEFLGRGREDVNFFFVFNERLKSFCNLLLFVIKLY